MSRTVIVRPLAEDDLAKGRRWYNRQRAGLGREFIGDIARTLERIAEQPELYSTVYLDVRRALPRRFPYAIYFRLRADVIIVSAVIHVSRSDRHWKSRFK